MSSFSVPADALPWAPVGFNRNVASLYNTPPIEEPLAFGSNIKSSKASIF
jgi:hypothetical protein